MDCLFATFQSPGSNLFQVGSFTLRWYGLLIALSVLIGLNLSSRLAMQRGIRPGLINDLLPILILSSIIGARIYYVGFEWSSYSGENFWSSINILGIKLLIPSAIEVWAGGIAIHGALIAGSISLIFFCRLKKQSFWNILDVIVPSVALGQAIGRWGNFFNNEAFGLPTNLPWKLFIPYLYRPEIFSEQNYFHPTFLYESLWNVVVFILLLSLFKKGSKSQLRLPKGTISCIYLIAYSFGRFWIEGLRTDPLCLGALPPFCEGGIRIAQLTSILLIALGTLGLWWIYQRNRPLPDTRRHEKRFK